MGWSGVEKKVRQAVVMIHGMGEQRPLETLNEFLGVGLKPAADGQRHFYSRPDRVTDSYEARRYLAPRSERDGVELHAQTEFFEYHWAHLMQGNKLTDLWPAFRHLLIQWPTKVPSGQTSRCHPGSHVTCRALKYSPLPKTSPVPAVRERTPKRLPRGANNRVAA